MPHRFEERMRLASNYASRYMNQFASGPLEGLARATAFILGSIVMTLLLITLISPEGLLALEIAGKPLVWCIGIFSSLWLVCRGLLREQHVFYPKDMLRIVQKLVIGLPDFWVTQAGTVAVLTKFRQLFAYRVSVLAMEFAGLVLTPWILFFRVRTSAEQILQAMMSGVTYDEILQYHIPAPQDPLMPQQEEEDQLLLKSEYLVPYLQRLENVSLKK